MAPHSRAEPRAVASDPGPAATRPPHPDRAAHNHVRSGPGGCTVPRARSEPRAVMPDPGPEATRSRIARPSRATSCPIRNRAATQSRAPDLGHAVMPDPGPATTWPPHATTWPPHPDRAARNHVRSEPGGCTVPRTRSGPRAVMPDPGPATIRSRTAGPSRAKSCSIRARRLHGPPHPARAARNYVRSGPATRPAHPIRPRDHSAPPPPPGPRGSVHPARPSGSRGEGVGRLVPRRVTGWSRCGPGPCRSANRGVRGGPRPAPPPAGKRKRGRIALRCGRARGGGMMHTGSSRSRSVRFSGPP